MEWLSSLIDAATTIVVADPVRVILALALLGAGWVISKLWLKLVATEIARIEMYEKFLAATLELENRAWTLASRSVKKIGRSEDADS